jgi:hypothetical protein
MVKSLLKRGALVAAANWEVVLVQFVAESAFKGLLMVPVVGAGFLAAIVVGAEVVDLLSSSLRDALALVVGALGAHPVALTAYAAGALALVAGGSAIVFLVKGGTVAALVAAEAAAGPIEQPPLRLDAVREATRFGAEPFIRDCHRLFPRFLRLGGALMAIYTVMGIAYLAFLVWGYRWTTGAGLLLVWTVATALCSTLLVAAVTVINLLYLLAQMIVAAEDCRVRTAIVEGVRFLRADARIVIRVVGVVLLIVVLATIASILATGAMGFIGFVPVVGLAVLPLQLIAWLGRGLLFQYIGLTALGAYCRLYRSWREARAAQAAIASRQSSPAPAIGQAL